MKAAPRITYHARARWASRVSAGTPDERAEEEIAQFIATGRVRPTPRSWTTGASPAPGVVFLYNAAWPGVCGIVYGGALVTFVTRDLCRSASGSRNSIRAQRRPSRARQARRLARSDRETRAMLRTAQRTFAGRRAELGDLEEVAA